MALKKRVVVVGLGSIGRRHARLLAERPDVTLEVVEPSAESLAATEKVMGALPTFLSLDRALSTKPDIVWLATPPPLHAEQTIGALEAGAHVFCEKPTSDRVAGARAMEAAARRTGHILAIGFLLRFHPGLRRLKTLIEAGALGNVLHAHARVGSYVTLVNSVSRYQATQEGSLFLDYTHQPDVFYWLTGQVPSTVAASGLGAGRLDLRSNPNVAVVTCAYDVPLLTTLHLNYVQTPERHEYEIVGDEGWAVLDAIAGTLRIGRSGETAAILEPQEWTATKDDIMRAQRDAFFEAVAGNRPPETPASEGLISTLVCEAATVSWREGRPVSLRSPDPPSEDR